MRDRFANRCRRHTTPSIIYKMSTVKYGRRSDILPRKGYKCLTVTDKVHEDIKRRAKATDRTIREYVECLLAKENTSKEAK